MTSLFDSFDASPLGAFLESTLKARGTAVEEYGCSPIGFGPCSYPTSIIANISGLVGCNATGICVAAQLNGRAIELPSVVFVGACRWQYHEASACIAPPNNNLWITVDLARNVLTNKPTIVALINAGTSTAAGANLGFNGSAIDHPILECPPESYLYQTLTNLFTTCTVFSLRSGSIVTSAS